jgi:transposase
MAVLAIRTSCPKWGPRRIAARLRALGTPHVPAISTIAAILARNGIPTTRRDQSALIPVLGRLHNKVDHDELPSSMLNDPDLPSLVERIENGRSSDRLRAVAIVADRSGLTTTAACRALNVCRQTYLRYLRIYDEGGAKALFARRINRHRKFDDDQIKKAVFSILHQPPSSFGINRTSWKMADLACVLKERGTPACEEVIRIIIKQAGFRWRKARVVLTSNDPDFEEKLRRIENILSQLKSDEAFFSIDEYGPFAVKAQPGLSLTGPGVRRLVQQWQRSKGCLIVTAAIELSSNQVTHFYSSKKNTDEMIRMMEVLAVQYRHCRTIYLSWDAASWHISKKLHERIEEHNALVGDSGPIFITAPLPTRAQFLNVIESIFSGMSRAIIHNSDYASADDAKAAIDRYFAERNAHFRENPRRAGGKIWGKERVKPEFSESNNCKDPRF